MFFYPVEIVTDLQDSDNDANEPREEEIKAEMALLQRSKKKKEKLDITKTIEEKAHSSKVIPEIKESNELVESATVAKFADEK